MVMLDRRKLAAPLFAQAGAFVAVLVIGGFTGHASTTFRTRARGYAECQRQHHRIGYQGTRAQAHRQGDRRGHQRPERFRQPGERAGGRDADQRRTLNSALEFAANVPAGQYQVCVDAPIGWSSAVRTTQVLAGWICSAADVRTGSVLVTFRLTPQLPQVGQ